jgi:myosin-5
VFHLQVEWIDNQACVDVIESQAARNLGVLAVLDSQCKFPAATDDTFMNALK